MGHKDGILVGEVGGVGVGIIDGRKMGPSDGGNSVGDKVGTADGILLGEVFNGRAVGDGGGSIDGVVLGKSVGGNTGGLAVGINVSVADRGRLGMEEGDLLGEASVGRCLEAEMVTWMAANLAFLLLAQLMATALVR